MKKRISAAPLLFWAFIASTSLAAEAPPLELKDIRIGESTLDEVDAKFPGALNLGAAVRLISPETYINKQCGSSYSNTECRAKASSDLRVAGATPGTYSFRALDGKVESISVSFHKNGFTTVRDALIVKYGEPSERKVETMQNRAGASFQSQMLKWERPDGQISIQEIGSKIDESRLSLYSAKFLVHLLEDAKRRALEGAKKL